MPSSQVANNFFTQRPNNGNNKRNEKKATQKVDGAHKTFRPKCKIWMGNKNISLTHIRRSFYSVASTKRKKNEKLFINSSVDKCSRL